MAKRFLKRVSYGLLLVSSLAVAPVLAAPIISIQPATQTVSANDTFLVDVTITDVTDLYAFQFDIGFDPMILSAESVTEGPFLPGAGTTSFNPGTIDNSAGTVTFTADSLIGSISGVTGSGSLATISFKAISSGTSAVGLSEVILLNSNLTDIIANTADGSVNVASISGVPEPATLALFSLGLAGIAFGKRRKLT